MIFIFATKLMALTLVRPLTHGLIVLDLTRVACCSSRERALIAHLHTQKGCLWQERGNFFFGSPLTFSLGSFSLTGVTAVT